MACDESNEGSRARLAFRSAGLVDPKIEDKDPPQQNQASHGGRSDLSGAKQWFLRTAWRFLHRICLAWLSLEHDGAKRIDDQLQQHQVHGIEHRWKAEQKRQKREPCDWNMDGSYVGHRSAKIGEDAPAEADSSHDRSKAIIEKDQVCGFAGDVGATLSHCDPDICCCERWCIIHSVSG